MAVLARGGFPGNKGYVAANAGNSEASLRRTICQLEHQGPV